MYSMEPIEVGCLAGNEKTPPDTLKQSRKVVNKPLKCSTYERERE